MEWQSVRKEVLGEIMKTDILCEIIFPDGQEMVATETLTQVFALFRDFEQRYSRFIVGNELWQFNESTQSTISEELFDILEQALRFHHLTDGLFDPSILPSLEKEGYVGAYQSRTTEKTEKFSALVLDRATLTATKPQALMIDLGGIGKGYIIDTVVRFLDTRFENFLVDAGGDIFVRGVNQKEGYPYWAIDVEHPTDTDRTVATLLLKDMAVATSGRNRRHWLKDGKQKHHLINPLTHHSAAPDFLSVTVLAENTVRADILAKTLFIAGQERADGLAEQFHLPALFIDSTGNIHTNKSFEPYVWKS